MRGRHHRLAVIAVLCSGVFLVQTGTSVRPARAEYVERVYDRAERGERDVRYNSEYIFATTRGVTDMHVPAALKVPLVPVTLVIDVALLPFEVVAGCF